MWNHPLIKPYQSKIQQGYSIYEVRRTGVVWEKLENWLNVDAVAVLRHKPISQYLTEEYASVYQKLFSQEHKDFDYSFDMMTGSATTCTEIISSSYGPIRWPTTKIMGRHVLQPDNLASLVLYHGSPIELVLYITGRKSGAEQEIAARFAEDLGFTQKQEAPWKVQKQIRACNRKVSRPKGPNRTCSVSYKSLVYSQPNNQFILDF